jgi:hypothetical protein
MKPSDPLEAMVAEALSAADIPYVIDGEDRRTLGLDFFLPDEGVHIEVKQFHTERTEGQMSRSPNVIVLQGRLAVAMFCAHLRKPYP